MSQIRINVDIPAGDIEVVIPLRHITMSETGTGLLKDALDEAVARVLRAYGVDAEPDGDPDVTECIHGN